MVGGLVMGALEKLYRQPSYYAAALLVVRERRFISTKRPHAKSVVPLPHRYAPCSEQAGALSTTHPEAEFCSLAYILL